VISEHKSRHRMINVRNLSSPGLQFAGRRSFE
jgi:hypothetical protein